MIYWDKLSSRFAQFQGEFFFFFFAWSLVLFQRVTFEWWRKEQSSSGRGNLSDSSGESGIWESFTRFILKSSHLVWSNSEQETDALDVCRGCFLAKHYVCKQNTACAPYARSWPHRGKARANALLVGDLLEEERDREVFTVCFTTTMSNHSL